MGNKWYIKEILWSHVGRAFNLNIHKASNSLLFSFSVLESYSDLNFLLAYYNIDTKDYSVIAGIPDGCAVAIDQKNDEIFLGGSDGIYKYNMITKIADFHKEKGKNIWNLFFKRNLFYINYPDQQLYMEIDDKFAKVKEFEATQIDYFHICNNNDIIYANKTGLYKFENGPSRAYAINELISVRQITEDIEGNVYVCSNIGIFRYDKEKLHKILDIRNLHGLAFDRDNSLIVSDEKRIFKLVESHIGCIEEEQW
ncbi:unnamed protein product [Leptosia nina]|uniref:Ommochrome-binding protein-like n=1 Tax=Leptosia nina TaxID=320188 RepID=A0AAV1IXR4_9NEOP